MSQTHLSAFDLPWVGTGRPEPGLLLVGRPDPRIGAVQGAWSNVRVRPPKVRLFSAPAIALGTLCLMAGVLAGFGVVGQMPVGTSESVGLVILAAVALGCGAVGFWLGRRLAAASRGTDKTSWFIGELGLQKNELHRERLQTSCWMFSDYWLLYERTRHIVQRGGDAPVDHGIFTRLDLVPRGDSASGPTVFVPPTVSATVREVVTSIRAQEASRNGGGTFPLFRVPEPRQPTWRAEHKGAIRLGPDVLEISLGPRTERMSLGSVTASVRDGLLDVAWSGDRAQVPLGEIADSPVLLQLLDARGVLQVAGA